MENKKDQETIKNLSISETCKPLLKKSKFIFVRKDENENYRQVKNCNVRLLINCLVSFTSFTLMVLFWLTDVYNQIIVQKVVLRNNSEMLEWYLKPPFAPYLKVYVFNYTNIDDFVSGVDKKIRINEIGPYIYEEVIEKINVQFVDDKITWQENRSHRFIPEMSGSYSEDDLIIAPNLPLISAIPNVAKLSFVSRLGFNTILSVTNPKEFNNITIRDYFFGYRDEFMNLISKVKWDFKPEDVGFLAPRRGISKYNMTIDSGVRNSDTTGRVIKFNGKSKLNIWKTDKCNEISGYDGIYSGPGLIKNKQESAVFLPEVCRALPLVFVKKVFMHDNIPTYHYTAPENAFSKPKGNFQNKYYCELKSVDYEQIDGVMDISDCIDGSPPIFASHPHFMEGDEKLFEHLEGLSPNRSMHISSAYLHPRFSVPVHGISRLQLNLQLFHHKNYYRHFPNGLILPLGWVETTSLVIPDEFKFKLYLSTVVVDFVEVLFKYGSLFTFIVSLSFLLYFLLSNFRMNHVMLSHI